MTSYEIFYYVDEDGAAPVRDYLLALPEGQRAKVLAFIRFLAEEGHRVRRPFADYLGDGTGLYEIRPKPTRVIYYYFDRNRIVLLHAFLKRAQAIPGKDLRIALDRKQKCEELIKCDRVEFGG